jgi:hypothetical protein
MGFIFLAASKADLQKGGGVLDPACACLAVSPQVLASPLSLNEIKGYDSHEFAGPIEHGD